MKKKLVFVFLLLGFLQLVHGQNSYTDSLKQQLGSSIEDTAKIILLNKISFEYIWTIADSGKKYAEEALRLSKKLDYKHQEGVSYFNLCICLSQAGNFTGALDFGFKALSIFEHIPDTAGIIDAHGALMICYRDQGDYKQALLQGYKAKELQDLIYVDPLGRSIILNNISSVYEKNDQLDSAIYYGLKAYKLSKTGSAQVITLGSIYSKMGNQAMALNYFRQGISEALQQQSNWGLMDTYQGMSKAFTSTRKMDSAILYAQKSFLTGKAIDNPRGVLEASKQLAHLYELEGIHDSAIKYLKLTAALNDSLFSRQKTREAQNFAFNEKIHKQELETQQLNDRNRIKMYVLGTVVLIFLLIAFILWRNNTHKQKANALLQQKNAQIESTLTELKSTQTQLIQSAKMASLGELTAGIAHEIQNPLNFVNNFSEVNKELIDEMQQEIDKGNYTDAKEISNDIKENEEKINHHGKRADAIVKGMLQHSQSSTGQKEPTDINRLTDEYLRLAYHGLKGKDNSFNVIIETDFDESIGNINIIPQDMGRVLLNLYNNAFYAAPLPPKGGFPDPAYKHEPTVWVSTKRINTPSGDGGVLISVKDNGPGIPQKIVDKIFKPFFTTKPTGQGTGLGLSLAYDIVKAHGGEIKVNTSEGKFTEFLIQLPISV